MTNETTGRTQNQQSREVNQNLSKKQLTRHQQEKDTYIQKETYQQAELQEEQWQTQRKKQHQNQETNNSKSVWRPVSPQTQRSRNSQQQEQETAGTAGNRKYRDRTQQWTSTKTRRSFWRYGWGCQEIASNLQDGATKGGKLPHVMHEGLEYDPSTDHRASNSAENILQQGKQQQLLQQVQNRDKSKQTAKENDEKQQTKKRNEKDQGKQNDTIATDNTPKSKNKPSKQKRDAAKRRQNRLQERESEQEQDGREESCNKFIMVDDNHGLDILPLQAQYEYVVDNSEDEMDGDNHSIEEVEEDDETSEALIRAFSPHNDQTLEEEIQQIT
ncbi:putative mediator of RNA polymerase II transcription subunit 26 [Solanum pennellii]|uniref:Mediator of RNA polymerase II transcription subunit 26 n=1 Tax=Solanum pennellii TaxID=28526 RepID=A0ABM1G1K6_SOLPN|nr:putative mediator of RNA polymerase II transcription subunit 26 [Solanum pennellii]